MSAGDFLLNNAQHSADDLPMNVFRGSDNTERVVLHGFSMEYIVFSWLAQFQCASLIIFFFIISKKIVVRK